MMIAQETPKPSPSVKTPHNDTSLGTASDQVGTQPDPYCLPALSPTTLNRTPAMSCTLCNTRSRTGVSLSIISNGGNIYSIMSHNSVVAKKGATCMPCNKHTSKEVGSKSSRFSSSSSGDCSGSSYTVVPVLYEPSRMYTYASYPMLLINYKPTVRYNVSRSISESMNEGPVKSKSFWLRF